MYNLFKAEMYKLKYSKELIISAIELLVLALIGVYYGDTGGRDSLISESCEIFGLMACTLFAITYTVKDISSKTINHALTSGNTRGMILLSKYSSYIVACFIILLLKYIFMGGLNTIFHGWGQDFHGGELYFLVVYMLVAIFFDLCIVSIPFFICILIKTSSIAITLSTAAIGIILTLSQMPWITISYNIAMKDNSLGILPFILIGCFIVGTILLYLFSYYYFKKLDIQ